MEVQLRGITKRFPGGVVACKDVDLSVMDGEVHLPAGHDAAGEPLGDAPELDLHRAGSG